MAQQLQETTDRSIQAYNLAAQAFGAITPPTAGRNIDVSLVTGPAYEIALKNPIDEDIVINADLTVNGDIYQNGSAYETHAEQLYTTKDKVIMRDGATTGLSTGEVSGLIMKKYDGVNDGALVVDNSGTARVGDVGDEQPLMTRDESEDLSDGAILAWDTAGQKATGYQTSVGSDAKPVKFVNGEPVAVASDLLSKVSAIFAYNTAGGSIAANTLGTVSLGSSRNNDSSVFELSSNKITVKKSGLYLIQIALHATFSTAGRTQVSFSLDNDDEYSYAIQYIQGVSGAETVSGSCIAQISANSKVGLTAWSDNSAITVSNAKQATHLQIIRLG